jgi:hypothetical protein
MIGKIAFAFAMLGVIVFALAGFAGMAIGEGAPHCGVIDHGTCGQLGASEGAFHGLIIVRGGNGSVVDAGAHASGGSSGCKDCTWTLVLACPTNQPANAGKSGSAGNPVACAGAIDAPQCKKGQSAYRLYLATKAEPQHLVDEVCLGGLDDVVPVGQRAAQLAARYMKDVRPPPAGVRTQPPDGILVQLTVYFIVDQPTPAPAPFGPAALTEKITIAASSYSWDWGDGSEPLDTDSPGGPYPDGDVTHAYHQNGPVTATVTTTWTGTYTFSVGGRTLGPFPATGTASRSQPVHLTIHQAHSHLVS